MILKKMFNHAFAAAITLIVTTNAQAQNQFTIHGQLAKDKAGTIVLSYSNNGKFIDKSVTVKNGEFQFKGEIGDPSFATLDLNPFKGKITAESIKNIDKQTFFLEGAVLIVKSESGMKAARIAGGKAQSDFYGMTQQYQPIQAQLNLLNEQGAIYKKEMNDNTAVQRIQKQSQLLKLEVQKIDSIFIKTRPDSYVAFDLWRKKHRGIIDPELEPEFKHFTPAIQKTSAGKEIAGKIELAKQLNAGKMAPDFTLKDTEGNPVSLSSLRGKNVLVCFWISNIMYFPAFSFNMNKINRTLHNKNLTILGVYYSNSNKGSDGIDYWKSNITKGSMNWTNVADMNGIDENGPVSPVAQAYGLNMLVLPQAFLIGPDGKILARHIRLNDTEVASKIEKLLVK